MTVPAAQPGVGPVLIIGQGLAGSSLGWRCEQAGVPFRIIDAGHGPAASRVGAGIINPLTGRRLVPTWRFAEWRDEALGFYGALETALGLPLVRPLRIRRFYRDPAERARYAARLADPAVARWIQEIDDRGCWIRGGAQVETGTMITALRHRWRERGWLIEQSWAGGRGLRSLGGEGEGWVIVWCVGAGVAPAFDFLPAERTKGEILLGRLPGLTPDVLLNDGRWVLPGPGGAARVGATYDRIAFDPAPTPAGREELLAACGRLTGNALEVEAHEAAVRVTTPDRRPVIGWHPQQPRVGFFGGLGSKGALWAPVLARQWLELLSAGRAVEPAVDIARYVR